MEQDKVMEGLDTILVPGVMRSLVKMNLIYEVNTTDSQVDISITSATLKPEVQEWLTDKVKDVAGKTASTAEINVSFVEGNIKAIKRAYEEVRK